MRVPIAPCLSHTCTHFAAMRLHRRCRLGGYPRVLIGYYRSGYPRVLLGYYRAGYPRVLLGYYRAGYHRVLLWYYRASLWCGDGLGRSMKAMVRVQLVWHHHVGRRPPAVGAGVASVLNRPTPPYI